MMSNNLSGKWNYPTKIIFGAGTIKQLPDICRQLGMSKPLLITDEGLRDSKIVIETIRINEQAGLKTGLFSEIKGNPTGKNIEDGVKAYHAGHYDSVIAFGGGSGIDAAKTIALMAGQDRPLWDFEDIGDNWTRVRTKGMSSVVAIPTTAGTGSEVGRASVIVNEILLEKKIIFHPSMMPGTVIADPELTIALPPHLTAATGIDAFVHCFEAFCSPFYHPMADGIALEGMRLIKKFLPLAYKDGTNLDARANMLIASTMGATAFQKGLGGVHALAHPLGGIYDKHHGLLNAILLPFVMMRNRSMISDKMQYLARVMDLPGPNEFKSVLNWILELRQQLCIPETLAMIDIPFDRAAEIGVMAFNDPSAGGNPVTLSAEDYETLFRNAVTGDLKGWNKAG
jgi:alcohol dehydrogenase class IV